MTKALVVGGSGLVGGHLLRQLSAGARYDEIVALTRRPVGFALPRVREVVVDLDRPESYREHLAVDDVYCCLGTTIKKAGSQEAFRHVDLEIPLAVAEAAAGAGARQYLIVTAVGADARSRIFYSRVKGELEEALARLPLTLKVFHPSFLLGERQESRPAERVGVAVARATRGLFVGGLTRYRAIAAADVARAMIVAAGRDDGPRTVYEGKTLFALL